MPIDTEARAVAQRLVDVVEADEQRLVDRGVDRATIGEIVVNGSIIALAGVYTAHPIGDEHELIEALRDCVGRYSDFVEKMRQMAH